MWRSDLGARLEEKLLHVLEQELPGLRVPQIETVVVDELLLGLCPFGPADAADLLEDPAAELGGERLEGHAFPGLAAAAALQSRHGGKIGDAGNVIQCTGRTPAER
jgi:hypothetical protein